jgi:Holliday junction DNA helicase RuvA
MALIGYLRGKLAAKHPPRLIIDVNGVGYEVEAPMSTFYVLPEAGADVKLFTHLAVREDAHTLFGFASEGERTLFRSLIRVSGVGAKVALAILSGVSTDEFVRCVREQDTAALTRLPGIGKKTAERLIVEMRDRVEKLDAAPLAVNAPAGRAVAGPADPVADAVEALVALGYKPAEANRMVRGVETEGLPAEEIIRQALAAMVRK